MSNEMEGRDTWKGIGSITRPSNAPKRKSVEFEYFTFTYDYELRCIKVTENPENQDSEKRPREIVMTFPEIGEFRAALQFFGLAETPGGFGQVHCR